MLPTVERAAGVLVMLLPTLVFLLVEALVKRLLVLILLENIAEFILQIGLILLLWQK
jgi:hypothetical protein